MHEKWNKIRPDNGSYINKETALATKGKRLYDRALKDLGGKDGLSLHDYERIYELVSKEFPIVPEPDQNEHIEPDNHPLMSEPNSTEPSAPHPTPSQPT